MPKGKKKKEKEPIDKFTEMEDEKLIEFINKTQNDPTNSRNENQKKLRPTRERYDNIILRNFKTRGTKIKRSNRKRRNRNGSIKQRTSK